MKGTRNWSKWALSALTVGAVLGTAGLLYASGADPHAAADAGSHGGGAVHHDSLSPEKLKDLMWRVLNFAALLAILLKFVKKPLVDALKGRRESIRVEMEDLEARRAEAQREYKEYEGKLSGIDEELTAMVEKAIAQGQTEKERIIAEAEKAAGNIQKQAEMAIQSEMTDARRRLKAEIADQAAAMSEEIIKKNLQDTDQEKLVEDYLVKVGGLK